MEKIVELMKQPSTWSGVGIIGALGLMFGIPLEQVQQAGTVVIGLIGLFEIGRNEKGESK